MEQITVNPKFIKFSLRNCGYSNYTALLDIIDNSLESDVCSKNVQVSFDCAKGTSGEIKKIYVSDDGCGMSFETLKEAMSLGSESGKSETTLGKFGVGLKTAAMSIGTKLTVYTKTKDDKYLLVGCLDLGNVNDSKPVYVDCRRVLKNNSAYKLFSEKVSFGKTDTPHGTVIEISKLDKLTCKTNKYKFFEKIVKECSITYNKILAENQVRLFVNDVVVNPFQVIPSNAELIENGFVEYKERIMHRIGYSAYYIPRDVNGESDTENTLGRSMKNQGIWIYRNNRLVGRHLTLGILSSKHPHRNGLRIELFMTGDSDSLFSSAFNKIIQEKSAEEINDGLVKKLSEIISPIDKKISLKEKRDIADTKIANGENNDVYERVKQMQNDNPLLDVLKTRSIGIGDGYVVKNPRGPQANPNPHKIFTKNSWLGDITEARLGVGELPFYTEKRNNKTNVLINVDHPFYTEIFDKIPKDVRVNLCAALTCFDIAREQVNYYDDDNIRTIVDEYEGGLSANIRKTLRKNN